MPAMLRSFNSSIPRRKRSNSVHQKRKTTTTGSSSSSCSKSNNNNNSKLLRSARSLSSRVDRLLLEENNEEEEEEEEEEGTDDDDDDDDSEGHLPSAATIEVPSGNVTVVDPSPHEDPDIDPAARLGDEALRFVYGPDLDLLSDVFRIPSFPYSSSSSSSYSIDRATRTKALIEESYREQMDQIELASSVPPLYRREAAAMVGMTSDHAAFVDRDQFLEIKRDAMRRARELSLLLLLLEKEEEAEEAAPLKEKEFVFGVFDDGDLPFANTDDDGGGFGDFPVDECEDNNSLREDARRVAETSTSTTTTTRGEEGSVHSDRTNRTENLSCCRASEEDLLRRAASDDIIRASDDDGDSTRCQNGDDLGRTATSDNVADDDESLFVFDDDGSSYASIRISFSRSKCERREEEEQEEDDTGDDDEEKNTPPSVCDDTEEEASGYDSDQTMETANYSHHHREEDASNAYDAKDGSSVFLFGEDDTTCAFSSHASIGSKASADAKETSMMLPSISGNKFRATVVEGSGEKRNDGRTTHRRRRSPTDPAEFYRGGRLDMDDDRDIVDEEEEDDDDDEEDLGFDPFYLDGVFEIVDSLGESVDDTLDSVEGFCSSVCFQGRERF